MIDASQVLKLGQRIAKLLEALWVNQAVVPSRELVVERPDIFVAEDHRDLGVVHRRLDEGLDFPRGKLVEPRQLTYGLVCRVKAEAPWSALTAGFALGRAPQVQV